ncbi:Amidophosphoribosyltransferase 1 [Citrus sinensis]|uniref:Amidophosphoribosyltransferase 1 n=1 Tax=Citrus sinensis TaxID=2711 RepID=A0ACB8IID6_CITSI|nr:Amidophosphoribosyltransferase 1 [Citrus sinensis]
MQTSIGGNLNSKLVIEFSNRYFLGKRVLRFGKRGKLSPHYIGPYEIIERIGPLAYQLALPPELSRIHDVFHVSMLWKYIYDLSHVLSKQPIQLNEDLTYEKEPVEILEEKHQVLRSKTIPLVKVRWRNHTKEEATWEREDLMRAQYPYLFLSAPGRDGTQIVRHCPSVETRLTRLGDSGRVVSYGDPEASRLCYLALHALQHRGQDGVVIVAVNNKVLQSITGAGLVSDVFNQSKLDQLPGDMAIGHVRYSTACLRMCSLLLLGTGLVLSDTEVVLHLIAISKARPFFLRIVDACEKLEGAYSMVFVTEDKLVAVRDPYGFRPLVMGRRSNGAVVFASVYESRNHFGEVLATEAPVESDVVIAVPDSGVVAALGYAAKAGVPFQQGLIRSHYVGRTFIEPSQKIRDFGVKLKLSPVRGVLEGKRVVVVDDSIVRGTTSSKIVRLLEEAGAKEVHMRIASPPIIASCYYGVDTPSTEELISNRMSVEEIREFIGCDLLAFLPIDILNKLLGNDSQNFCYASFSGKYPVKRRR